MHLSDGTLRRLFDEPGTGGADAHLEGCEACRERFARLRENASTVGRALELPAANPLAENVALARVRAQADEAARPARDIVSSKRAGAFAALAAAAVLTIAFSLEPVRTAATNFLAVFEPRQFVAIPVTQADAEQLRALPDLAAYGTFRSGGSTGRFEATSAVAASRLARFAVLTPAYLPAGLEARGQFQVFGTTTSRFTFSAARAAATAAASHERLAPMPANLDGSSLQATLGPIVTAFYLTPGNANALDRSIAQRHRRGYFARIRHGEATGVAVVQAPAPRVWSSGASVAEIENYLLAQPGVPPQLAAEIRAIGDPASTLPIPIPVEREYAQPVVVQGQPGLGIGDNTGLGAGVVWQVGGKIYAVAGSYSAREILAVANSLR